jgi:hypothetical protein
MSTDHNGVTDGPRLQRCYSLCWTARERSLCPAPRAPPSSEEEEEEEEEECVFERERERESKRERFSLARPNGGITNDTKKYFC